MFGKRIAALTASLPAEVLAAARKSGASRDYFETGQQYLDRLRSSNNGRIPGNDVGQVISESNFDKPRPEFNI
jgi:poly-gamma-glutamate capsule biosynthesis protein CapA/YwtB (metallophosphatase superfamily)